MATTVEAPSPVAQPDPRTVGLQIEAKLADWHLSYTYLPEFPIQDVRAAEWAQVREIKHIADKDTLSEFVTQMRGGAVYPPIVLMHPDVLVDGNHRLNAARKIGRRTIPAVVVQFATVNMAKSFAAAMNQMNGRRLTAPEAFEVAGTMFEMGLDDDAIAREIGRSQESVRQMRRRKQFERRAETLGITEQVADVKDSQRVKLAMIDHDPVFDAAAKIVAETRPQMADVNKLVKAAQEATSDGGAIEALNKFKAEMPPAGPPPVRVTVPSELR